MPVKTPPQPADPYASLPDTSSAQQDPYASMPDAYEASAQNTEGTYKMMAPDGTILKNGVPYSKVMDASKAGYKIATDDRIRFGKDKVDELSGKRSKFIPNAPYVMEKVGKFNPNTDLPEAYTEIGADQRAWYKPTLKGTTHKLLGLLPTVGAWAGGMAGGGAGLETGPGTIATGAAGAGAGAGIGEAVRQEGEEFLFPYQTQLTPGESARGIGVQAGMGAVSEGVGRGLGQALKPAANYFKNTAAASEKAGFRMLPSEAAGEPPSVPEKILKESLFTRGKMAKFRVAQNAETKAAVEKIADGVSKFKGTPEQLGEKVQEGIEQHTKQFRVVQKQMYDDIGKQVNERTIKIPVTTSKQVPTGLVDQYGKPTFQTSTTTTLQDKVVDDVMPSTKPLKAFAEQELKKLDQIEKILDPNLLGQSRAMLQNILDAPDELPYSAMRAARSDTLAKVRELDQALAGKQAGLAKKMAELFDSSIMDAVQKSKIPGLAQQVRAADAFTAEEHKMFEQQLVDRIVKTKKPEAIAALIRAKGVGNEETRDLFKVLPQDLHQPVQRQVILNTMSEATDPLSKTFNERKFAKSIAEMGDERGRIIFGANWKNVKDIASILERINGTTGMSGSAASLQNAGIIKGLLGGSGLFTGMGAAVGGHPLLGAGIVGAEALSVIGYATTYRTLANAMTNPEAALKFIEAAHGFLRAAPQTVPAVINATGGLDKGINRVKEAAQKLQTAPQPAAPVPQVQFAPDGSVIHSEGTGPQSSAKPVWTHVFNPDTGEIEAA